VQSDEAFLAGGRAAELRLWVKIMGGCLMEGEMMDVFIEAIKEFSFAKERATVLELRVEWLEARLVRLREKHVRAVNRESDLAKRLIALYKEAGRGKRVEGERGPEFVGGVDGVDGVDGMGGG